tara:strand:- start:14 stop:463 length:450 start_codon:yes stop_codon:yes gene_type:complete
MEYDPSYQVNAVTIEYALNTINNSNFIKDLNNNNKKYISILGYYKYKDNITVNILQTLLPHLNRNEYEIISLDIIRIYKHPSNLKITDLIIDIIKKEFFKNNGLGSIKGFHLYTFKDLYQDIIHKILLEFYIPGMKNETVITEYFKIPI